MRAMRFAAGVHASGGFGIGGPIRPATEYPGPDEEIYVRSVIDQLQWRLRKGYAMQSLGLHCYLLIVMLLVAFLRDTTTSVRETNYFIKRNYLAEESVHGIDNSSTVVTDYLPGLVSRCWGSRQNDSSPVVAVNFVAVRQFRLNSFPLDTNDVIQRSPFETLSSTATASGTGTNSFFFPYQWARTVPINIQKTDMLWESQLDTSPIAYSFNTTDATSGANVTVSGGWLSNQEIAPGNPQYPYLYLGQPAYARQRIWPSTLKSYSITPPLMLKSINSTAEIDAHFAPYAAGHWISTATAAIIIDTFFFGPGEGYFYKGTTIVQVEHSVRVVSTVKSHPFRIISLNLEGGHFRLGTKSATFWYNIGLTVGDFLVLVGVGWAVVSMARRLKVNKQLESSWPLALFKFWELYELVLLMLAVGVVAGHIYLTVIGSTYTTAQNPETSTFIPQVDNNNFLAKYSYADSVISTMRGWMALLVMLRSFQLLQFMSRLSVVTETVQTAAQDIIGVGVILAVILFGFSIGGLFLYGNNVTEFSSLTESFTFFAMLVGSGELRGYKQQEELHWSASIYYFLFFFIAYFVLLNVIIGILAASFVTTVETFDLVKRADWSPEALARDLRGIWRRLSHKASKHLKRQRRHQDRMMSNRKSADGEEMDEGGGVGGDGSPLNRNASFDAQEEEDALASLGETARITKDVDQENDDVFASDLASSWDGADGLDWVDAHLRLLNALQPIAKAKGTPKNPSEEGSITLQQLRSLGGHFFPQDQVDVLFSKAQSQLGTRNGKLRHVRLLSRRNMKGTMLMDRVGEQYAQVLAIKSAILGSDALTGGKTADTAEPKIPEDEDDGNEDSGDQSSVCSACGSEEGDGTSEKTEGRARTVSFSEKQGDAETLPRKRGGKGQRRDLGRARRDSLASGSGAVMATTATNPSTVRGSGASGGGDSAVGLGSGDPLTELAAYIGEVAFTTNELERRVKEVTAELKTKRR